MERRWVNIFFPFQTSNKMMDSCAICEQSLVDGKPTVQLRVKGRLGISKASKARRSHVKVKVGQYVHVECRKNFIDPNRIVSDTRKTTSQAPSYSLRSLSLPFNSSEHCLFCGKAAKLVDGRKRGYDVFPVRTVGFYSSIKKLCEKRNDEWGNVVAGRLACIGDLHIIDAVYHQSCSVNFRTFKNIPLQHTSSIEICTQGRREEIQRMRAFQETTSYFEENDEEQLTVADLAKKMEECLEGTGYKAYSIKYLKEKLKEHYGNQIIITEINGKPNVVTFRSNVDTLLFDFYKEQRLQDSQCDAMRIIKRAAVLI